MLEQKMKMSTDPNDWNTSGILKENEKFRRNCVGGRDRGLKKVKYKLTGLRAKDIS